MLPGLSFPICGMRGGVDGEGEDQLFLHLCFKTLEMVQEQPLFPGVVSLPRHLASFPWENPEALFGYQGFFLFPLLLVLNLEFLAWAGR